LLRISNERRERRDLAVGLGGRQREVELTLLVDFDLVTVDGVAVVEQQQLVMRRDYLFDESALLGKQEEEGRLEAEMAADAVRQILYRLRQVR
jgi:LPS-assembly lipoprotein